MCGLLSFRAVFCSRALFGYCCACLALQLPLSTGFCFPSFFGLLSCSHRHTRFLANASIPGRVYASAVAVRALPCVSAQLSTSARAGGCLARRGSAPRVHASSDWRAAAGVELRTRGRPGGPAEVFCDARLDGGLPFRLADSQLNFFKRRKNGGRAVERAPAWV